MEPEPVEPSLMFLSASDRPRRGRPRAEEPCTSVSTWMPDRYHDRLIEMANEKNVSVSRLVRHLLVIQLKKLP